MSNASTASKGVKRRALPLRQPSATQKDLVSRYDAYTFALRAAYLCHLLQPKLKRLQHAPAVHRPPMTRQSTSVADMVKDLSHVRDSKSTRFPHSFMSTLDKRIADLLVGKEKMPEYADPQVKRSFAAFLNEFRKPDFRRGVEKDRRVEDLLLIFYSNATKQLSQGKAPDDDHWKLMVERHVALFIRLISSTLKANDWAKDRPELSSRLQTLEKKLLTHDQDLSSNLQHNGGAGGTTTEVEVPRSSQVKDMPHVLTVASVFGKTTAQVQTDIDEQKDLWTEKAALQDLKMYQTNVSLNTRKTLRREDFDSQDAYEKWKKSEAADLSQMMLAIVQSNPELAKSTPGVLLPQIKTSHGPVNGTEYSETPKSAGSEDLSPYILEVPVDLSSMSFTNDYAVPVSSPTEPLEDEGDPYTFIPPDTRAYFRQVLKEALAHDLSDEGLSQHEGDGTETTTVKLLSKKSTELLTELALRWRLPLASRVILFLDVVREKFSEREIDLETLDAAFSYTKEPPVEKKKVDLSELLDRSRWTLTDVALQQRILTSIHDTLLRDLFEQLQHCYDVKAPEIGPIMTVLETHVYDDPQFPGTIEELDRFGDQLQEALYMRAEESYQGIYDKEIGSLGEKVEFFHVMQLGKSVLKLVDRIRKRYRKVPQIMGVEPLPILLKTILPAYVSDASERVTSILHEVQLRGEEISVQDGFDLYKEMVEMRSIHRQVLPDGEFDFHIEGLLATFVWRFIAATDEKVLGWVEAAVRQDKFTVRESTANHVPTDEERHSESVLDIFRSFNQAVKQINQLEWGDDLQYAKFMTALSKTIGGGLSKYAELLEQYFSREMDRPTPEQEAAVTQTRQERWMRLARDALSNKEKIEPFQFLSESLVKLNDVEYAMLQLDKLEKEVDADMCAEIIRRREAPPSQRQRKNEKFVFTIKIIEAEDLKACDMNGLSDPYVVLGDEHQKRLAKTRVISGSLNPRWEESVDIVTQGLLNIVATIWDHDMMGDHDYVGRTSIKLDPSHFRDFMPREYWLDLDTQGRLLVRVSMEGERDDIQFYFGKTFRQLKRTERDMTRKITDKLSAYIQHCLSRRSLKALTSKGITISSVSSYFQRTKPQPTTPGPSDTEVANALTPLFTYFNENFAIMQQTLTSQAMVNVMTRLWKEVLATIESLLVPPLSDKPSTQRQLSQQELDVVFKWRNLLYSFFLHADEDTGIANGVPADILKSPKYLDLQNLNFFYYETTENLIRTSERMAVANAERQREIQAQASRISGPAGVPASHSFGGAAGLLGTPSTKRSKTVMHSRNLGTMKKAKEAKRKEAQAEPSDDMILRILRMRPEAERYLRDRSRQKERLATLAAADMIVQQSLAAGGLMLNTPKGKARSQGY